MLNWNEIKARIGQEKLDKVNEIIDKVVPSRIKELFYDRVTRTYIALGSLGAVVLLYLTLFIVPICFNLSSISGETRKLNADINLVNTRIKQLDQKTTEIDKLKKELAAYSKGLPNKKEIPEFLEDLSSIAKASKVKILSITPSELKSVEAGGDVSKYYLEMPIDITAKSGYHQLGKFINNLEKGERFVTIKDLRIQYDSRVPRMPNIKITLRTYVSISD